MHEKKHNTLLNFIGASGLGQIRGDFEAVGEDPITSALSYRLVVQAVLLFRVKTWVLSEAMEKRIAGSKWVFGGK